MRMRDANLLKVGQKVKVFCGDLTVFGIVVSEGVNETVTVEWFTEPKTRKTFERSELARVYLVTENE